MDITIQITVKQPLTINVTAPDKDWEDAPADSRNLFIKTKIKEYLNWNLDTFLENSEVVITPKPE
jgi:hypothetical protein